MYRPCPSSCHRCMSCGEPADSGNGRRDETEAGRRGGRVKLRESCKASQPGELDQNEASESVIDNKSGEVMGWLRVL